MVKSKLLFGLEAVQLQPPQLSKLEIIHLRGLRQILKITTTYVNRAHTNEHMYAKTTEAIRDMMRRGARDAHPAVRPLREALRDRGIKFLGHLLRKPNADPMRDCVFMPGGALPIGDGWDGRGHDGWTL